MLIDEGNANEFFKDFFGEIKDNEERIHLEKKLCDKYSDLVKGYEELRGKCFNLENTIKQTEEANLAKTQFLANMSHEIRTPINGIIGIVDLLEHTNLNGEQKGYLSMLKSSSDTLVDIIGNILDMSIIESGKLQVRDEVFDIKEDIINIINQLVVVAHKKNIKIMYYIEPFTKTLIKGDKLKLNQVLINLMNNSIKYTDEGHIFLSVKTLMDMGSKIKYQFSIEDTGIGIDEDFKDKIFGAFNQEDLSYAKKYNGAGLGLAISKRLISLMNGEIWYESKKGVGSTFYFTVEFMKSDIIDNDNNSNNEGQVISKEKRNNSVPIILIAEDNEINKKLAAAFLAKKGYDYLTASNGAEAVEVYEREDIDIILMDIQMPELNGFEATKIIRQKEKYNGKHIPIIAMTAYAMTGDREKCLGAGMDDYISKPISANILYEKIERNMNNRY
jgi:signal transduction histidine kinase/ActR/RegA family two-component response regulator